MKLLNRASLTLRLTLLFTTVSTAVLLLLGLQISALFEKHFEELDKSLLVGKLELVSHELDKIRTNNELNALPTLLERFLVGHNNLQVQLLTAEGQTLYITEHTKLPPELLANADNSSVQLIRWIDSNSKPYRGIAALETTAIPDSKPILVAIATDLSHHQQFIHSFNLTLWMIMAFAALLNGFLGWLTVKHGLAPLREISRATSKITASHLDSRLDTESFPTELAEIVKTLNEMLARLEDSFHRLSDFSSDLAHELRTPVSNLLTQTQVTLSKARTQSDYQEILASNAEEFERLSRMIADMLFLAKSDNALMIPHREKVDLMVEIRSLLEFYDALTEEKGLSITCIGGDTVFGDRLMLRRAISNLLSNAIRYTPHNGHIDISVRSCGDAAVALCVANTGKTISAEHLPRLFDRFYRTDASRQYSGEGTGLGLAITQSIVKAHGGVVDVWSANGTSTFEIRLPS